MIDFLMISTRVVKGIIEIYPKFIIKKSSDLMIRGGDFYAIWDEDAGLWNTEEQRAIEIIDSELDKYYQENKSSFEMNARILHMWDASSNMIDSWHKYCQKQCRDNFHSLDKKLIFSNDPVNKKDYASKKLNYPLQECNIPNYDKLMNTLYDEEEKAKLEWAIGSVITGDSKKTHKFLVLYGAPGSGKSTVLDIIQMLFDGYCAPFDAKALGSANASFALEPFKNNPLVGIQDDGDLSRIEDNTRLNSLVSHATMSVNEKFKSAYSNRFETFLFMGTNKPVRITDSKSGVIRRLIDVTPTGNKLSLQEYKTLMKGIKFELGGIAWHCKEVFLEDPDKYESYIPQRMMEASNDFYNFILDSYFTFKEENGVSLKLAWEMYKTYCDEAKVPYPLSKRVFKEELRDYFNEFEDSHLTDDGKRARNYYYDFKSERFESDSEKKKPRVKKEIAETLIDFKIQPSYFDNICKELPAQYANENETPLYSWSRVKTKLKDVNTAHIHYVKVPQEHIVIDFDIPDKDGNKDFKANLIEASKWPKTYAELSKSGKGIHLHYIWKGGDPSKLSRIFDDHIEIKVFTGNSSLRRKLTECNDLPIAELSSGLPLKGENKVVNFDSIKSEKALRTLIKRNLEKEYHSSTKQSVDFIFKILEDAYNSELKYDVSDLRNDVTVFATNSTNNSDYCLKLVNKMHFRSEESSENIENDQDILFYDIEVFPNLLLVNYKRQGPDKPVIRMINPTIAQIEELCQYKLIGFNCRRYDNHILYARMMGYSNEAIFELSKKIINEGRGFFSEAYNISYTDVYDFTTKKQSLKKWEIELGIHHLELSLPWDKPVPEEKWEQVAVYCDNDVIATEAVFDHNIGDWMARQIQVELAKSLHSINNVSVNDTTNTLSQKIIFGNNKAPQGAFNYRDLSKPVSYKEYGEYREKFGEDYIFRVFDDKGLPTYQTYDGKSTLPTGYSILPFFPGYEFNIEKVRNEETGITKFSPVSRYLGDEVGEGGRVFSNPGIWTDIWDGDVSSMHPHSVIYECLFGPEYTKTFKDIVDARVAIKHKDFDSASKMLNGVLAPYLNEDYAAGLAQALKIVINSIYGLTSAKFSNPFKDSRNADNIVAKRGALFMTLLKQQVEKQGYTVAHIKTDSIKIPNADLKIRDFVLKFGEEYGYSFETEAEFSKFCLVNDAVYIAKFKEPKIDKKTGKEIWWTATGKQFAVPYVFKKLFSKEQIDFDDMCETFQVTSSLYLDLNEELKDVSDLEARVSKLEKELKKIDSVATGSYQSKDIQNEIDELKEQITEGHNYHYIGRIGLFTPVKPGIGGGILVRESNLKGVIKYDSASGAKGYRWLESETVKNLKLEKYIDKSFYDAQIDTAIETIAKYGDFEWFAS